MNHLATKLWGIITIEIKFGTRKSRQMVNPKDKRILAAAELRRRAEKLLESNIPETIPSQVDDEPSRLLHELQVHQVELEMQNAELLQSRDKLEIALANYSDLYDFAPVGYLTLDSKGVIRTTNLTGSGLIGRNRAELLGRRFGDLISVDARPFFSEFLENVIARQGKGSCEMTLASERIDPRIVQIEASAVSEKECRIALIDITERKRADVAQARLATLVDSSDDSIIAKNLDGIILNWNTGSERLFGYQADEIIGKSICLLLPPELQEEEKRILRRLSTGERIEHFETVRLTKDL
jgi:PAS domain S-box-containing protein